MKRSQFFDRRAYLASAIKNYHDEESLNEALAVAMKTVAAKPQRRKSDADAPASQMALESANGGVDAES